MSNRIVPQVYRAIIDEVMANIKSEFEEFGVDEDVMAQLQNKWETKVVASNVAQFEPPAPLRLPRVILRSTLRIRTHPHRRNPSTTHTIHLIPHIRRSCSIRTSHTRLHRAIRMRTRRLRRRDTSSLRSCSPAATPATTSPGAQSAGKDRRRRRAPKHGTFAPAGGVQLTRVPQVDGPSEEANGGGGGVDGWDEVAGSGAPRTKKYSPLEEYMKTLVMSEAGPSRISQLDGSSEIDAASPPLQTLDDGRGTEEIGSDLDDSDDSDADDVENEGAGEAGDYVFCTYDKVQRVKNKWKCVLKDGMIHVNGKDYLFMKCNGQHHSPMRVWFTRDISSDGYFRREIGVAIQVAKKTGSEVGRCLPKGRPP
ncbi:Transcription factor IIA, alpha/beta subunit [Rhizoctonia solani]|uniref:Transcription factor IIA, alpha/beta subunit n=1 Tax=Rhizoctonia solani TaxID=456999 RepID=A0A8H7I5S7_9AGAM|nr:Transcription factor IIA, alpha/beta subunit [Rhizoctonia solani]